jgi:hypothetical protein
MPPGSPPEVGARFRKTTPCKVDSSSAGAEDAAGTREANRVYAQPGDKSEFSVNGLSRFLLWASILRSTGALRSKAKLVTLRPDALWKLRGVV